MLQGWEAQIPQEGFWKQQCERRFSSNPCCPRLYILANVTHTSAMSSVHILRPGVQDPQCLPWLPDYRILVQVGSRLDETKAAQQHRGYNDLGKKVEVYTPKSKKMSTHFCPSIKKM